MIAQAIASGRNRSDKSGTVVAVGHQPTPGRAVALVLIGTEAEWKVKKSAVGWLECGNDEGDGKAALLAVICPEFILSDRSLRLMKFRSWEPAVRE